MHIVTRNVNTAFKELVQMFHTGMSPDTSQRVRPVPIIRKQSRNGDVLMLDEPIIVTYLKPTERVLFNSFRDANPFFHLYEAMWMLAGRNDVESVAYYAKQMKEYSDDGKTLNGAYGYRWRNAVFQYGKAFGDEKATYDYDGSDLDQLDFIVTHLKAQPESRRAVLQMWNVKDDLRKIQADESGLGVPYSKDVCCNLSVMFSIREQYGRCLRHEWMGRVAESEGSCPHCKFLDMTVTNRSNDMIWGMLGANYVHFSFLQEYMAARLGVEVGKYNHISNNLHVYTWNWKPEYWLQYYGSDKEVEYVSACNILPLIKDYSTFETDVNKFVDLNRGKHFDVPHRKVGNSLPTYQTEFFNEIQPLMNLYHNYKRNGASILLQEAETCDADDWRTACIEWLKRRKGNADYKEQTDVPS